MSRSSYLQRIAHATQKGPRLRPPLAIFRRWELTGTLDSRQSPRLESDPVVTERVRQTSSSGGPTSSASRLPQTNRAPSTVPDQVVPIVGKTDQSTPNRSAPTIQRGRPSEARRRRQRAAIPPGAIDTIQPQHHLQASVSTEIEHKVNRVIRTPNASDRSSSTPLDPDASEPVNSSSAASHRSSTPPIAEKSVKPDELPRALQPEFRSEQGRPPTPTQSLARLSTVEKEDPTVKIGTIDIHITPPSPPPATTVAQTSVRATPPGSLSRGFTSLFGLRQG